MCAGVGGVYAKQVGDVLIFAEAKEYAFFVDGGDGCFGVLQFELLEVEGVFRGELEVWPGGGGDF